MLELCFAVAEAADAKGAGSCAPRAIAHRRRTGPRGGGNHQTTALQVSSIKISQ
jgi:hypothetical protein